MTVKWLTPTSVMIQSELKAFSLGRDRSDPGFTDGSIFAVTYSIPDAADPAELRREIMLEKKRLDLMALNAERLKGAIPDDVYNMRVGALKTNYARALGDEEEPK